MWIQRDLSKIIAANRDPLQVLGGPRQCGKSSLVLHLDPSFRELSLDDPSLRELAQTDPELFLRQFEGGKIFIDEAQYAPNLFPSLKRKIDLLKRVPGRSAKTVVRLTGSNQILIDRQVKESLAGRASFFTLNTLSVAEILRSQKLNLQQIIYQGGWPELYATDHHSVKKYLDDYINSYIEKDIVLAAGLQKSREFLKFAKLLAGRIGGLLDYANLGKEVGVDSKTIKDWVGILERMHIIALVPPYFSNLSSRLVKSPKVYFLDTGLACRLQGWTSPEPILTSPQQGPLFENLVFAELFKMNQNFQLDWQIFHWRSRAGEEIDFLLQKGPREFQFVEAKVSPQRPIDPSSLPEVRKVFGNKIPEILLCHQEGRQVLGNQVPIAHLQSHLL